MAKGGPTPLGAQKANLSAGNLPYAEEIALNEQVQMFNYLGITQDHTLFFTSCLCTLSNCGFLVCVELKDSLDYTEYLLIVAAFQGHALFTRQAGGANPCPLMDFVGGFNAFFARAYGLPGTVEETYGQPFNPFLNDQNFFLSVVTLEELGATG